MWRVGDKGEEGARERERDARESLGRGGVSRKRGRIVKIAYLPSSAMISCAGLEPYSISPACTAAEFIAAAEE
jgi:hypothetical protein